MKLQDSNSNEWSVTLVMIVPMIVVSDGAKKMWDEVESRVVKYAPSYDEGNS
jgi:hypothetical protein